MNGSLYIPLCSDKTTLYVELFLTIVIFISHYVQIKRRKWTECVRNVLQLYIPLCSDKTIEDGMCQNSHIFLYIPLCSDKTQFKVLWAWKRTLYPTMFR